MSSLNDDNSRSPDAARTVSDAPPAIAPQDYWRSLEQLSESPEFEELLQREFPPLASQWRWSVDRRDFLRLAGASLALAGVTGCTPQPSEEIVPYVRAPEQIVPGRPLFFATAMTLGGFARGVLAESHMGRPTKIEGNPDHPASRGATDAFAQASVLSLYDPDRSQTVLYRGNIATWDQFLTTLARELSVLRGRRGAGLHILTETVTSPTLGAQLRLLLDDLPAAVWHQYEPIHRDNLMVGAQMAFGRPVETIYHFNQADVILALDADFLIGHPGSVCYARDFIDRRRVATDSKSMSRLYSVESTLSLVGAMADHRFALSSDRVEAFTREVARRLGVKVASATDVAPSDVPREWIDALVHDLQQNRGRGMVIAGIGQPPIVHALAHAMNDRLGNAGKAVVYVEPVEQQPVEQSKSLDELVGAMRAGEVKLLVMLGGNPVYNTPADLDFTDAMTKVGLCVHLSDYFDETSFLCHWHVPAAHYLESWSDARAFDGTASIIQPLIAPLYNGRTPHEIVAALAGHPERTAYELVQQYWRQRLNAPDFDLQWRRALHDGLIPRTKAPTRDVKLVFRDSIASLPNDESLELVFRPDYTIWDGRFANNGWLQELPKPLTKIVWDNAVVISTELAQRHQLKRGDVVTLQVGDRSVRGPIWIAPGQAKNSITVSLGYGRTRAGYLATNAGFSAYMIRTRAEPWIVRDVKLEKTGLTYPLVSTQEHWSMEGRDIVRTTTLAKYQANPRVVKAMSEHPDQLPTLYPGFEYTGHAWGMVIDQTACIGCNACVLACAAENNTPVVGKRQVDMGREMNWLRIDRYHKGPPDNPETFFQPVLCMHCENAPCEVVCPVEATVHSSEGLNEMVYNRCVGTRYCSNNCPYKVRRFNFLQYTDSKTNVLKLMRNPDVTVRARGVMEKCTYCVQRINEAKIDAEVGNRSLVDGDIVTACQAACPTRAITFGDLNDQKSQVTELKASPLNYALLAELNTRPRTTYLARVRNPSSDLELPKPSDEEARP